MAVSPPPGNCEQALQDAVAVEPFHATACAPWRTCTQPTPSWKIPTLYCVVPENIHTPLPMEGPFASDPPPPGISIPGGRCHTPLQLLEFP